MNLNSFEALGARFAIYDMAEGESLPRHVHSEDHLLIVGAGIVRVVVEDGPEVDLYPESKPVLFRAGRHHSIQAIARSRIINVFRGVA